MLQHAQRRASAPLFTILHAAAGRAWVRTSTARARGYHRTSTAAQGDIVARVDGQSSGSDCSGGAGPSIYLRAGSMAPLRNRPAPTTLVDVEDVGDAGHEEAAALTVAPGFVAEPSAEREGGEESEGLLHGQESPEVLDGMQDEEVHSYGPSSDLGSPPVSRSSRSTAAAHELSPSYEDDPPWNAFYCMEGMRHMPSSLIDSHVDRIAQAHNLTAATMPDSVDSLRRILLRELVEPSQPRQPRLARLMELHACFPQYQSSLSFNLLLSFAMEQNNLKATRSLFQQMKSNRIDGDIDTRKLGVRYMVKTNRWMEAWKLETSQGPPPLRIWVEFLTWDTIFGPSPQSTPNTARRKAERQPSDTLKGRLLTGSFPELLADELAATPPHAVFSVVRWLIRTGKRDLAWQMTVQFFQQLPQQLPLNVQRICLDIIHLHLLPRPGERGSSEFKHLQRTLSQLLGMHAGFRPNGETLFLLLRPLQRANSRTNRALQVVKEFKRTWGEDVVSEKVRRRVASFAISENRVGVANTMLGAHQESQEQAARLQKTDSGDSTDSRTATGVKRPPRRELFPQNGAENWKWRVLRKRLERIPTEGQG